MFILFALSLYNSLVNQYSNRVKQVKFISYIINKIYKNINTEKNKYFIVFLNCCLFIFLNKNV